MKRLSFIAIGMLVVAVACGKKTTENNGGGGGTGTPSPVVTTSTQTFTVPLVAAAEVPAIANAEKDTAGSATIKFNITKTDNVITDVKADFSVTLTGFPAGSSVTISHIHVGAAGANGAIIVDTTLTSGQTTLTGGAGSFTKTGISVTPDVANSIINSPASYYFNVHSDMNKSGVIRGQLNGVTGVGSTAGGGSGGSGGTGGTGGTGGPTYEDPYAQ